MNVVCFYFSFFFFSSRRRHTRCSRDWSSDVCSSDLQTIDLTWTDNSAFEDGYEVQRCCQTGWIVVASLPANAVSYRDAGLISNAQYSYTVRAKKDQGFSEYSNYASAITATAPPSAPVAGAYPASSSITTAYWYDTSGIAETFRVERSFDGGGSWAGLRAPRPRPTPPA